MEEIMEQLELPLSRELLEIQMEFLPDIVCCGDIDLEAELVFPEKPLNEMSKTELRQKTLIQVS